MKPNKSNFSVHAMCLICVLAIGNTLIYFPKGDSVKSAVFAIAAAAGTSFLCFFPYCMFFKKLNNNNLSVSFVLKNSKKKPLIFIFIFLICLLAACFATKDYVSFIDRYRLIATPRTVLAFCFLLVAFLLSLFKKEAILKFALISFVYILISVPLLFILSSSQFNFKNLLGDVPFNEFLKPYTTILAKSFLPVILTFVFFRAEFLKKPCKTVGLGFLFAALILILCMLNVLLVFGDSTAKNLSIPYAESMSVIVLGKAFTRLEGYSYLNYYLCSVLKAAVSIAVLRESAEMLLCSQNQKSNKETANKEPYLENIKNNANNENEDDENNENSEEYQDDKSNKKDNKKTKKIKKYTQIIFLGLVFVYCNLLVLPDIFENIYISLGIILFEIIIIVISAIFIYPKGKKFKKPNL